jgi:hypothetical protein
MTQEDFITDLSAHLRRQGVEFDLAELGALAAEALKLDRPDMETLTDRFVKASRTYAVEFHKRREARDALICGSILFAAGLVACAFYFGGGFGYAFLLPASGIVESLVFGLVMSGIFTSAWGGLSLGLSCYRSWRASTALARLR